MTTALSLLKLLLDNKFYQENHHRVSQDLFPTQVHGLLDTLSEAQGKYARSINLTELFELHLSKNPTLTTATKLELKTVLDNVNNLEPVSVEVGNEIIRNAWKQEIARKAADKLLSIAENREGNLEEIKGLLKAIEKEDYEEVSTEYVDTDIGSLVEEIASNYRWKFNIAPLAVALGNIGAGTFGIISAVPDCLARDTEILMYGGYKKLVQDIVIGDAVMGPDSTPRVVLNTVTGMSKLYNVTYCNGSTYTVTGTHSLSLSCSKVTSNKKYADKVCVKVSDYIKWSEARKAAYKGWRVAIEYLNVPTAVDPYFLGLWLGDGDSRDLSITNPDKEVIDYIHLFAAKNKLAIREERQKKTEVVTYNLHNNHKKYKIREYFKASLFNNKHIPREYLINSTDVRLNLLAGILDADGYLNPSNTSFDIVQKSKTLAYNILDLAQSVGLRASICATRKRCTNTNVWGDYYRLCIGGDIERIPTKIARKKASILHPRKSKGLHFGFTVKESGIGEFYGFEVDSDDSLFVLGDYTVTKNCGKTGFTVNLIFGKGGFIQQRAKVHYIGNEEPALRTMLRGVNCYTGLSTADLIGEANAANRARAQEAFNEIKGSIFIPKNVVDMTIDKLDRYCKDKQPDILIIDQVDKLKITGYKDGNDVARLSAIYMAVREIAKRRNVAIIGVCQAGDGAQGKLYYGYDELYGSRTMKAGEADYILCIGALPKEQGKPGDGGVDEGYRMINIAKNKSPGGNKRPIPCTFDLELSRVTA